MYHNTVNTQWALLLGLSNFYYYVLSRKYTTCYFTYNGCGGDMPRESPLCNRILTNHGIIILLEDRFKPTTLPVINMDPVTVL